MTLDIHSIMQGLAESRPIFHSEADFQFALAWHIKEAMPDCELRLEFKPFPDESMSLDIWLPTIGMALELKYLHPKTDIEWHGERFVLKGGARDGGRYEFVKDIQRLERVVADKEDTKYGYAILLANDYGYWDAPLLGWKSTIDVDFRIHEGRQIHGPLRLRGKTGENLGKEALVFLSGLYDIRWQDYSKLGSQRNSQFRYLVVSVGD